MTRIIHYSDLHLEFGTPFVLPDDSHADILILAGDVITFSDCLPLIRMLEKWTKPVLYVAGNHEYYTDTPMKDEAEKFKKGMSEDVPNLIFLQDEYVTINDVNFFGGTMWTNFNYSNVESMTYAYSRMNDYRRIMIDEKSTLYPDYTVELHNQFVEKLLEWFAMDLKGPRVVISHHCPTAYKDSMYNNSEFMPAYNSLDMRPIIKEHQPNLWIHGHTHECLKDAIGKTRIMSNQRGYKLKYSYECEGFDPSGALSIINNELNFIEKNVNY